MAIYFLIAIGEDPVVDIYMYSSPVIALTSANFLFIYKVVDCEM